MKTNPFIAGTTRLKSVAGHLSAHCATTLLSLLLLLALPTVVQAQFSYEIHDGTITITRYTGSDASVIIPSTITGLPVTGIRTIYGDAWPTNVTSVAIPASVTNIGVLSFISLGLTAITVDTNNPAYSSAAGVLFNKDQSLLVECPAGKTGNYTIPGSVTTIDHFAFYDCFGLTNVSIGNSVASIGDGAFDYCTSLTNVSIPNSVENIGEYAFYYCANLTSVTIPYSVTNIGISAFTGCGNLSAIAVHTNNPVYSSADGVLFNKDQSILIVCPSGKAGSCTIPNSVTNIAFQAFTDCRSLTNITIGNNVTSIGFGAFSGLTSLIAATVDTNNPVYSSADGVLFNKDLTTLILCPEGKVGNYTMPDSVTRIGDSALASCTRLTSVTIRNSVTDIGIGALANCFSLTKVAIPNSVTNIGDGAFYGCRSLTDVIVGKSVASIGDRPFLLCGLSAVYFQGNAPAGRGFLSEEDADLIVYYLPGTTGWSNWFGGCPTALWNPTVQTSDSIFGVQSNRFGFNITGTEDIPLVVEGCANLTIPVWVPLQSCTLTNGQFYFSDPQWTNSSARFYRIRSP